MPIKSRIETFPKKALLLIIVALAAGGGYLMGLRHGVGRGEVAGLGRSFAGGAGNHAVEDSTQPRPRKRATGNERLLARRSLLARTRSDDPIIRMEAFVELAKHLDEEELGAMLDEYTKRSDNLSINDLITVDLLVFAWGRKDPEAALAWAGKLGSVIEGEIVYQGILDGWAREDPVAALAWAREYNEEIMGENSTGGNRLLVGVIKGMSGSDFDGATRLMADIDAQYLARDAADILVPKIWEQGEGAALDWAGKLPAGEARDAAYRAIGKRIASADLDRAVQWIDGLEESAARRDIAEDVAQRIASADPSKAAAWVGAMPAGETRSRSIGSVVSEWVNKDPAAAAGWLAQFPSDGAIDGPIATVARSLAGNDPAGALAWADTIKDAGRRQRTLEAMDRVSERKLAQPSKR